MTSFLAFGKLAFGIYSLRSGETVVVPPHARARLRVHDGVVWATSSGDPDDVWLRAGEEHALAHKGRTVIESTGRSTIELVPAAANGMLADQWALLVRHIPSWLNDAGTFVTLAAIVAVTVLAAHRVFP